jgi:hypothetical protein
MTAHTNTATADGGDQQLSFFVRVKIKLLKTARPENGWSRTGCDYCATSIAPVVELRSAPVNG